MNAPYLNDFQFLGVLGEGSYGKVYLVEKKADDSKEIYAMKVLQKEHVTKRNQVERKRADGSVLDVFSHPFIVELKYAFHTPSKLHLVLEHCPGGHLFSHLSQAGRFQEDVCRFYASEMLLALGYLHACNIIYRDLKPDNLLLDSQGHVKITDVGLSKDGIEDTICALTMCGTPEYLAPELVFNQRHGRAADWYSLGALTYEMLTGLPPYYTKDRLIQRGETNPERRDRLIQLLQLIQRGELTFPANVSTPAKDTVLKLMRKAHERLGAGERDSEEVKDSAFFAEVDFSLIYEKKILPPRLLDVSGDGAVMQLEEFLDMPLVDSDTNNGHESNDRKGEFLDKPIMKMEAKAGKELHHTSGCDFLRIPGATSESKHDKEVHHTDDFVFINAPVVRLNSRTSRETHMEDFVFLDLSVAIQEPKRSKDIHQVEGFQFL